MGGERLLLDEGESGKKKLKINPSDYLSPCLTALKSNGIISSGFF